MNPTTRAVILGLTAILVGLPIAGFGYFLVHMVPDGHADFRANYTAGYILRTGQPLYRDSVEFAVQNLKVSNEPISLPFIHPAYEALLYVPLSFLNYLPAYWVWFALNLGLLVLLYRLLRPELKALSIAAPWLPAASFAAFLPIGAALVQGQDSLLVLFLFGLAYCHFRRSDNLILAGMLLGSAVFRFQVVVPIVLCFVVWRRWRVVAGSLISVLGAAILSIAIGGFWPYVDRVLGLTVQSELAYLRPITRMPNLRGLIESFGGDDRMVLILSLAVLGVAMAAGMKSDVQHQFSLAITAASLVSYHCLVHDLSILFIPLTTLIGKKDNMAWLVTGICFFAPTLSSLVPDHSYLAVFAVLGLFIFLINGGTSRAFAFNLRHS